MPRHRHLVLTVLTATLVPIGGQAQDTERRRTLHEGSAVVTTDRAEYTIRILCDDGARPELGFTTEANRLTRQATGRSNMVNLRLRPWKDTEDVSISLDGGGIAWIPQPTSAGGILSLDVVLRPGTFVRNGQPVLVTYDMWKAGDIPDGETHVHFEANCASRDPSAPSFRQRSGPSL
ncbi:MAG: hypothetical protein OEO23_00630 [Gemmatimonadota bacterium]|nr:hypothetical protein [Gemmatimonadota bacterium]